MKWLPGNLFKYQFIRPKKNFRTCYTYGKESETIKFHIVEKTSYDKKFNKILSWCNKCYGKDDEWAVTIPCYMIDYNLLLQTYCDFKNEELLKSLNDIGRNNLMNSYKELKKNVNQDPYFRYLKRVNNRNKLYNKQKKS